MDYSEEDMIMEKIDELYEGNSVSIDLDVGGGTLSITGELGGYLDTFANMARNSFSEVHESEKRYEMAVSNLVEMQRRERRLTQKSLKTRRGRKLRMRRIGDEEFQKNIDEGSYGDQEQIISEIYLITNDPEYYLIYKVLRDYDSGDNVMRFVRERGYWMKYGMVIGLVSDISSRAGWNAAVDRLEEMWNDQLELYDDEPQSKRQREMDDIDEEEEDIFDEITPKKRRMSAPRNLTDGKISSLYNYLSLYLEPAHDFLGGNRSETKDKKATGSIKDIMKNKNFKNVVLNPIKKIDFKERLTDIISGTPAPIGYGYKGKDEGINLMEIMKFLDVRDKCLTLKFKQASFKPDTDDAESLGEKIQMGIQSMLKFIVNKFFVGINRVYRDADGTGFIHSLEKKLESKPGDWKVVNKPEDRRKITSGNELFAEKMLDAAGKQMFEKEGEEDRTLRVDYLNEVFKVADKFIKNSWGDYIVKNEPKAHQIQIKPYPLWKTDSKSKPPVMNIKEKRIFKINLGNGLETEFEPSVHDISLFIKYYMYLAENATNKNDENKYNDMIWVLISIKRMGDHGQAERARVSVGAFESGDRLSAGYGMMIDTPTLFRNLTDLTMYKTSSKVSQIIKVIQQSSKAILKIIPEVKILETLANDVSRKYQYDGDKTVTKEFDKSGVLLDTMTLLSSINTLLQFVTNKINNTSERVVSETFQKMKKAYDKYKQKLESGVRVEPSKRDLAETALFFFSKRETIDKALSGFDILVKVIFEIKNILNNEYFDKYKATIVQMVKNNISSIISLPNDEIKQSLNIVIDGINAFKTKSENIPIKFIDRVVNPILFLGIELEDVAERIESLLSAIQQIL